MNGQLYLIRRDFSAFWPRPFTGLYSPLDTRLPRQTYWTALRMRQHALTLTFLVWFTALSFIVASAAPGATPARPAAPSGAATATPPNRSVTPSPATATAPNTELAIDRQLIALVQRARIPGQAVELKAAGQTFLGLYLPATGPTKQGAVILLPGLGAHPDWPGVIATLRRGLPPHGWATLSIQLPVPAPGPAPPNIKALLNAAPARIQAAIAHLHQLGLRNLILIGHGLGAAMGVDYLVQKGKRAGIQAFVGIGMGTPPFLAPQGDPQLNLPAQLAKITVPILDIYGGRDDPAVLASAPARAQAANAIRPPIVYTQVRLPGARHSFANTGPSLVRWVRGWLKHTVPGMVIGPPHLPASRLPSNRP